LVIRAEVYHGLFDLLLKRAWPPRAITAGCAVHRKEPARLTLAAALAVHSLGRQFTAMRRAYSFFSNTSFRISFTNIASVWIFFSYAFSFSRAFSRLHQPCPSAHASCANDARSALKFAFAGRAFLDSVGCCRTRATIE